jgi:TrmH family RNA methyltransferase
MQSKVIRINGQFLQWQALLNNRTKRIQTGKFIVQGVRPINVALSKQLVIEAILYKEGRLSDWANDVLQKNATAKSYELSQELIQQLGEKKDDVPELLLIARMPKHTLKNMKLSTLQSKFVLVLDRPQSPGNIGAVVRSADALGAAMVVITGHAADIYDPKSVRASRGSLFAIPVVPADSTGDVKEWIKAQKTGFSIVGLSEDGDKLLWNFDLTVPALVIIGNETWGLSKQWKEACTSLAKVPMRGSASSLNAASSAAIALYEYSRQSTA